MFDVQHVTKYLFFTLILSLGFGQLLRFEYFGLPAQAGATVYLHDLLVLGILALQGYTLKGAKLPAGFKYIFLGLGVGWLHALILYPFTLLLVPALYTLRLLAYLALYITLKQSKLLIPKAYFLVAGLTTLAIGTAQYFFLPDMRVFQYLGWDDHLNRLTLPHFDPTFTAVMLVLALLLSTGLRSYIPTILLSCAILLTYSRSVWLSLALTCMFFIKNKVVLIVSLGIMLLAIIALPQRFGEGTNLLRTYSITSRVEADVSYIQKYRWDLLIGRGMNTLMIDSIPSQFPNHATGPNNSYLYLLATSGIIGLWGWLLFLRHLYTQSVHKAAILFIAIASLFNNILLYPFVLLWILLLPPKVPSGA